RGPRVEIVAGTRRLLGQDEAELRHVGGPLPGRRVVQLEDEIGTLGNELRGAAEVEALRPKSRIELPEDIVGFLDRVLSDRASLTLPDGAPASTHAPIVAISRSVSRRSLAK